MDLFANPFDDSKMHESIFGERNSWHLDHVTGNSRNRVWDEWDVIASANKEAADRLVDGLRPGPINFWC